MGGRIIINKYPIFARTGKIFMKVCGHNEVYTIKDDIYPAQLYVFERRGFFSQTTETVEITEKEWQDKLNDYSDYIKTI